MKTAKGTLGVWITSSYSFDQLNKAKTDEDILRICLVTTSDMSGSTGCSKVGTAEVTIELFDADSMILSKAESIKKEIKQVQADAEIKVNYLKEQLSQLLAITNKTDGK